MEKMNTLPEKGALLELEIFDMTDDGRGIARYGGLVVFVSGCVVGDVVSARVTKVKKRFALAACMEILKESPWRIPAGEPEMIEDIDGNIAEEADEEVLCPYIDVCGGCAYGRITYDKELELKERHVQEKLSRIGGAQIDGDGASDETQGVAFEPITAMTIPYRYRNKAQMQISTGGNIKRKGGIIENLGPAAVGFYEVRSHNVIDCLDCQIQSDAAVAAADALRQFMEEDHITAWDDKWEQGLMRHMVVRPAFGTGEVMVVLVINGKAIPNAPKLIEMLDDAIDAAGYSLESIWLNVNKDKTSQIFGKEFLPLAGKNVITEQFGHLTVEISPASFYQVNPVMAEALYNKALEYAGLTGEEYVLDLYCGVGSIGLWMADKAKYIIGIESVKPAVLDANRNAVLNGVINARYICGKAEEVLPVLADADPAHLETVLKDSGLPKESLTGIDEAVTEAVQKADVVILDPPRKGCHTALLDAVRKLAPERIVYVSCDPATLARDIAYLSDPAGQGDAYTLKKAAPFDMFPRAGHVETVVSLSRAKM